jgi:signal transduction histidine kinase
VLLNLLSNAIKFSKRQDTVKIVCKLIKNEDDLSDKKRCGHLFKKCKNGMLEVSVQDHGTGIKKEDQDKLFKLFGFLDRTEQINTKGIGLGLHISKMIVEKLGGDIYCESEWEWGSTFTYLIALDQQIDNIISVQRFKHPNAKQYPIFTLKCEINQD